MNATEFAILGLLAEGPLSGYDIKKEVEERLSHFWSQSYGTSIRCCGGSTSGAWWR